MFRYLTTVKDIKFEPLIHDSNIFIFKNITISKYKIHDILFVTIRRGQIDFVKYLINTFSDINIHITSDYPFRLSCEYGHLQITQWLINTFDDIDVHACNDSAFIESYGICFRYVAHI